MSESKKKRMAMLDSLAAASAPPPSMMSSNRALRSARDAVDTHHVWDLDPRDIVDTRVADRLDAGDVHDLRDAIEANGQTVPILVRRHPTEPDRYLLVYGRRRLEAIRGSDKVDKVRALVAQMDEKSALRAQISENMARRDLTFIEKALFARELLDSGFGTQSQIAEVLTVTKSAISMALAVVESVGADLIRAIGPAQGIGRPRWEGVAAHIREGGHDGDHLCQVAHAAFGAADRAIVLDPVGAEPVDPSVAAFEAVENAVKPAAATATAGPARAPRDSAARPLRLGGRTRGTIRRSGTGLRIDIQDDAFSAWLDDRLEAVLQDLHTDWKDRRGD